MAETIRIKPIRFACPHCKQPLQSKEKALQCGECNKIYNIVDGIPNFIGDDEVMTETPNYQWIKLLEFLAPIYESAPWTSFLLSLAGAKNSSQKSTANFISETLDGVKGSLLEIACGPATNGRWLASADRNMYGIDFCLNPLQQGMKRIAREGITGVYLARTRAAELPFENQVFDGGICCGSLHLLPDTLETLQEIARTLKAGAILAITTFVAGDSPLIRLMRLRKDLFLYQVPDLLQLMSEAGFGEFKSKLDGNWLMLSTSKTAALL